MATPRQKPVYAFIDSQNLNLGIRSQGWKLDFAKFRRLLLDRYKVHKAFLFIGLISKYQPLYDNLAKAGYSLIFKPTVIHKINYRQWRWRLPLPRRIFRIKKQTRQNPRPQSQILIAPTQIRELYNPNPTFPPKNSVINAQENKTEDIR